MTLKSSGFWSLTLGFFLLMQSNGTAVPANPVDRGGELPAFSNQVQTSDFVGGSTDVVTIDVFEQPDCSECHGFSMNTVVPMQQLYRHNPGVELNVYVLPNSLVVEEGDEAPDLDMAKYLVCAADQDQFWALYYEFHAKEELLNAAQIDELILEKELEIDTEALSACLQGEEVMKTLEENQRLTEDRKVELSTGYPTTFVQDVQFIHNQPLENVMRIVDQKALERLTVE